MSATGRPERELAPKRKARRESYDLIDRKTGEIVGYLPLDPW